MTPIDPDLLAVAKLPNPAPRPPVESAADTLDLTAAVEAAARALWARATMRGVKFDDRSAHDQDTTRAFVRPIVAAAAPVIAEQAWDEGHEAGLRQRHTNPYRKQP